MSARLRLRTPPRMWAVTWALALSAWNVTTLRVGRIAGMAVIASIILIGLAATAANVVSVSLIVDQSYIVVYLGVTMALQAVSVALVTGVALVFVRRQSRTLCAVVRISTSSNRLLRTGQDATILLIVALCSAINLVPTLYVTAASLGVSVALVVFVWACSVVLSVVMATLIVADTLQSLPPRRLNSELRDVLVLTGILVAAIFVASKVLSGSPGQFLQSVFQEPATVALYGSPDGVIAWIVLAVVLVLVRFLLPFAYSKTDEFETSLSAFISPSPSQIRSISAYNLIGRITQTAQLELRQLIRHPVSGLSVSTSAALLLVGLLLPVWTDWPRHPVLTAAAVEVALISAVCTNGLNARSAWLFALSHGRGTNRFMAKLIAVGGLSVIPLCLAMLLGAGSQSFQQWTFFVVSMLSYCIISVACGILVGSLIDTLSGASLLVGLGLSGIFILLSVWLSRLAGQSSFVVIVAMSCTMCFVAYKRMALNDSFRLPV